MRHGAVLLAVVLAAWAGGCSVSPRAADPAFGDREVNAELINTPVIRVEVLRVNDAWMPGNALERSLRYIEGLIAGQFEIVDRGVVLLQEDADGRLSKPFSWPLMEDGRAVSPEDFGADRVFRLSHAEGGVQGAVLVDYSGGEVKMEPLAAPGTVLMVVMPRDYAAGGVTGYHRSLARLDEAGEVVSGGGSMIVLQRRAIVEKSGGLVERSKLWEWTITHELGHALRVPAQAERMWSGPHPGAHCTRPECVMYAAADWRSVMSGLVNGWPLRFCGPCEGEIGAARAGRKVASVGQ